MMVFPGDCFGLLGMNGAGKTTIFKMMTCDLTITNGEIYFNGVSSIKHPNKSKFMSGYCPQIEALNTFMTGYETIKYISMIRGIPFNRLHTDVMKLLEKTDLLAYAHVPIKLYSGGTKRKLNTAIAIVSFAFVFYFENCFYFF